MPSFYKNIYGYFDFENIYKAIVEAFPKGRFIEIGTWLGKSTCFMAELIKEGNLPIKFYGIDNFKGEINATDQQKIVADEGGLVYNKFLRNMKDAGVIDYVTAINMDSVQAAALFDNQSFDFIFLDAEHLYDNVKRDLQAWYPKLKRTGIMGGHDYHLVNSPVKEAVDEYFSKLNKKVEKIDSSFIMKNYVG